MNPSRCCASIGMLVTLLITPIICRAAAISLSGPTTAWKVVNFSATNQFDYFNDSQAGSANLDLVGDSTHAAIYTQYDDRGTTNTADDLVAFRVRLGGADNSGDFSGVLLIGIDGNLDGKLDLFLSADGRNNGRAVKIWSPGADANISPSTTSIAAPANQKIYPFGTTNYSAEPVTPATDPILNLNTNLNGDSKGDIFVSFALPFEDVRAEMLRLSGIAVTASSPLRYVAITLTQNNSINGDISGLNGGVNETATYASLGLFSTTTALDDTPPTVTMNFTNLSTGIGIPVGPLPITISDAQTSATNLVVTGLSSNTVLVPNVNIIFGGTGSNRTVTVTPAAGQSGQTLISVIVSDGTFFVTNQFVLTVTNLDTTAPSVVSMVRYLPAVAVLNSNTVVYRVTFSEPVTGVDASDFSLVLSGTASGSVSGIAMVDGSTYEVTVSGLSGNGTLQLRLNSNGTGIIDAANNSIIGGEYIGEAYTLDALVPAAPVMTGISDDTGVSATDFHTGDNTLNLTGAGEPQSTIMIRLGGVLIGTAVVDNAGNWNFDYTGVSLTPGTNSFALTAVDSAGNESAAAAFVVFVDRTLPSVGSISRQSPSNALVSVENVIFRVAFTEPVFGVDLSDFVLSTSGSATGIISGMLVVDNSTYDIVVSGLSGDGNLRLDLLGAGTGIGDFAGNFIDSGFTTGESFIVDRIPPINPALTIISDDTGGSAGDFLTRDTTLVFEGIAESNNVVSLRLNGVEIGVANADPNGNWSFDYTSVPLAEGANTLSLEAFDAAGNHSNPTNFTVTIDTSTVVTVPDLVAASDSGALDNDNVTSVVTPAFTGSAEPGTTVALFSDGMLVGSTTATNGSWIITASPLTLGTHVITASATDVAGNDSGMSGPLVAQIVSGSPSISVAAAASVPEDGVLSDLEVQVNDDDSEESQLVFEVSCSDTNLVPLAGIVLTGTGGIRSLSITPAPDQFGTANITLTVRDESSNSASAQLVLTVDSVNDAPTADALTNLFLSNNSPAVQVGITGISAGPNESQPLSVSAFSLDPSIVSDVQVAYVSPGSNALLTLTVVSSGMGTSVVSVIISDGIDAITNQFTVTVLNGFRIIEQPLADVLCAGGSAKFHVVAAGDGPFTYQWRFNGLPLPGWTNDTLELPSAESPQVGVYDVVVSNPVMSLLSAPANLGILGDNRLRIVQIKVPKQDRSAVLILSGPIGQVTEIHGTFDFQQWTALTNFTFTENCFRFVDPQAADRFESRYYKLVPMP